METIIESIRDYPFGQSLFLTVMSLIGVFGVLIAFFLLIKLLMKVMPEKKE
jgi:hypothetical protein